MNAAPQNRSRIIVAFALLYVLWGSTYLAMRVIVRDIPPYVAGAVRYLIAGPIMLAACALMGRKISLTRLDLRRLLVISILLLSIGNIGVLWGEVYVSSGLASLIVALVPIWVVMIEAWVFSAGRMTAKGTDWAGNRDCRVAGAAVAADHLRHAFRAPGAYRIGHSGRSIIFLGAGICVFTSIQSDGGCVCFRGVANDSGRRHQWRYRAGDWSVPENTLDYICAERYWLSCGLWIVDWLLGLYLSAGARANAKGGDLCLRQSNCRGFSGLDYFARARRHVHAAGDGDYYRVSGAGEHIKTEADAS